MHKQNKWPIPDEKHLLISFLPKGHKIINVYVERTNSIVKLDGDIVKERKMKIIAPQASVNITLSVSSVETLFLENNQIDKMKKSNINSLIDGNIKLTLWK